MGNKLILVGEDFDSLNDLATKDDLKKLIDKMIDLEKAIDKACEYIEKTMEISSADYFPIGKNEPLNVKNVSECLTFLRKNRDNLSPIQIDKTLNLLETVSIALIGHIDKFHENEQY